MEGMSFLNKKYFSNIVYMEIAERDRKLLLIKNAMKANQEHILQKLNKLEKTKKENAFLNTIYENQQQWTSGSGINEINDNLKAMVSILGISSKQFNKCQNDEVIGDKILTGGFYRLEIIG